MGTAERRKREIEARRRLILDSARRLFERQGFDATTVDRIAGEAELSKATVYHYFPSKHEMLGVLQLERLTLLHERLTVAVERVDDPMARLLALGRAYMRFIRERQPPLQALFVGASDRKALGMSTELERAIIDKGKALFGLVEDALRAGMEQGNFRTDLEPSTVTYGFWGVALGVHALGSMIPGAHAAGFSAAVAEEFFRILQKGMEP